MASYDFRTWNDKNIKFRKRKEMEIADLLDLISEQHLNLCLPKTKEHQLPT